MPSHLTAAIQTGRRILEIERLLAAGCRDQATAAALGAEHEQLMQTQQDQMIAASKAGASWETIRFALQMHGQDATRQPDDGPSLAETLDAAMRTWGPAALLTFLDTVKASAQEGEEMTKAKLDALAEHSLVIR